MPPTLSEYRSIVRPGEAVAGGKRMAALAERPSAGLVSVVTITFNAEETIDRTISSVAAQTYPEVEYIVVDGGSRDQTVARLKARENDIDLWISEPDRGISDAFNKGIALARGEYVALVNADDWLEPEHLAKAVAAMRESRSDFAYGDLMLHTADGAPAFMLVGEKDYGRAIRHSMPQINHPTVVCRRAVYEKHGLFDTRWKTSMDYEWLLRGYRGGVRGTYVPSIVGHMTLEGVSDRNIRRVFGEVRDISVLHGYSPVRARIRYVVRRVKSQIRLLIRGFIPKRLYEWLRQVVNVQYRSVDGKP